jgi:EmrB/QacA subfamily drug resistance transporter
MGLSERVQERAHERRWLILVVLCFGLLVIVVDNSILNVALPSIADELDASNTQLQWTVDSYTLVFAGLLLTAGSLGDRFGRRPALQVGFLIFGLGSLASAFAGSADMLIATRAFMGIGGAFIMPATLSIITNVFSGAERGRAIGVWAATAGVAAALGPISGGLLLEHFYWGSIFLVNLPIVALGILAGVFLIPDSKDPHPPRLDPVGAVLSVVGLCALLFAVIEGPEQGWTSGVTIAGFVVGAALLAAFFVWEVRSDHPMLDFDFFRNPRFSGASVAIMLTFFAMFGSLFVLTQYLQLVLGYTPLETGVRLLAFAIPMMLVAPQAPRLVERIGTKAVVASGMSLTTVGLLLLTGTDGGSTYADLAWRMVITATGLALTMAPATESIMGSLPLAKAGVGSAVNDTTRQVGGAVGVAVIGSVFTSLYASGLRDGIRGLDLTSAQAAKAEDSLAGALQVARGLSGSSREALVTAARSGFLDGMHAGLVVGACAAALGVVLVLLWLPARAPAGSEPDRGASAGGVAPSDGGPSSGAALAEVAEVAHADEVPEDDAGVAADVPTPGRAR